MLQPSCNEQDPATKEGQGWALRWLGGNQMAGYRRGKSLFFEWRGWRVGLGLGGVRG